MWTKFLEFWWVLLHWQQTRVPLYWTWEHVQYSMSRFGFDFDLLGEQDSVHNE